MFQTLELAERRRCIAEDAVWSVASGEVAVHPDRDRIIKLFEGKRAHFLTNCMKYDEGIAKNLADNPGAAINLSIDSGTAKTWARVKGVDNFDQVMENLSRYYVAGGGRPGQVTLKYIVFPGVNDNYEDYAALMEIMKAIQVEKLAISRDVRVKYNAKDEYKANLMGATAYLAAMCQKNQIAVEMDPFSGEEQAEIRQLVEEILEKGLI